jgi:hypothetical protein
LEELVLLQAWARLKRIEHLKFQILINTIAQSAGSSPKFDNINKLMIELQELVFPAVKQNREQSLAFGSEVLDTYRGKPVQVTPIRLMRDNVKNKRTFKLKR